MGPRFLPLESGLPSANSPARRSRNPSCIDGRSLVPQILRTPGIPRAWTHNDLGRRHGGETPFDGNSRHFRDSGKLIDARALPLEKEAAPDDPAAIAARQRLAPLFKKLRPDEPRPAEPFGAPALR